MSNIPRIFINSGVHLKDEVFLDVNMSNYILHVLRLKIGDQVNVFNNSNLEFTAAIVFIDKHKVKIRIEELFICNTESDLKIHLGQGISRGEKMDFTIQKSVELGVATITPVFTEYCNVKLKGDRLNNRMHHWKEVSISAASQSKRCFVPQIMPAVTFQEWIIKKYDLCLILDPYTTNTISDISNTSKEIAVLVGPEGGFTDQEIFLARRHDFIPIKIGPRILRTETASLAIISILQEKWGDF